ncbi:hypothetical protein [Parasphingorhabdus sp.]|uniref:hypothetical protein n=1 Tax=Parasphingorhabdus sp. TaxID=2709688 RepID=UPI002F92B998
MTSLHPIDRLDTHDVASQPPTPESFDRFSSGQARVDAVTKAGSGADPHGDGATLGFYSKRITVGC